MRLSKFYSAKFSVFDFRIFRTRTGMWRAKVKVLGTWLTVKTVSDNGYLERKTKREILNHLSYAYTGVER